MRTLTVTQTRRVPTSVAGRAAVVRATSAVAAVEAAAAAARPGRNHGAAVQNSCAP